MGHKKSLSAIAYTRVSSEKQVDNYSLDFQEDFCSSYAKANNMELKKYFVRKVILAQIQTDLLIRK